MEVIMLEVIVPIADSIVDGMYSRTAFMRAGNLYLGAKHKKPGLAILMSGTIRIIDGDEKYEVSAPLVFPTKKGSQKAAFAVTDCTYCTVHRVEATTVEGAEKELFEEVPQLTRIRNSYKGLLKALDTDEDTVQKEMLPAIVEDSDKYYIAPSAIQGVGCYTKQEFKAGDVIAMAQIDGKRLGTARYINHSDMPNCILVDYKEDSVAVIATTNIPKDFEMTLDYRKRLLCQP